MVKDGFVGETDVFQYVDEGATHSESYWGPRFHIPMEDLYPSKTVQVLVDMYGCSYSGIIGRICRKFKCVTTGANLI